ncbi:nitroreductase family protein [Pseudothioclava arenosa]|uniref:Putative NAD(P)H nitroreductase n=1 Tax=Pseudothioclava arenosa TaxID=1795308 RepID=A0A2A4CQ08_9RHOB|nr:nitroreductase [Pseudothioclava arenosa]PCD76164.1 nitroreductase [Pseudothioclava arenosa]
MQIPPGTINPATRNEEALRFLLTRRSRPAKTLTLPVPGRAALEEILTAAARSPDHGKLEPWRFIALARPALERLAGIAEARARAAGLAEEAVTKAASQFAGSHCCIAVIACPRESDKVPEIEQTLSVGAVCTAALNAALAAGWGANWLTGWVTEDAGFRAEALGLADHEWIAGFIHLGTETSPPPERPRPDLTAITTWVDA